MALDRDTRRQLLVAAKVFGLSIPITVAVVAISYHYHWDREVTLGATVLAPLAAIVLALVLLGERGRRPPEAVYVPASESTRLDYIR